MDSVSIFDLSPSEKLQLVEDLWDDLAAAPEGVPVSRLASGGTGAQESEPGEKPASGLLWEEVKRKVRARYAR